MSDIVIQFKNYTFTEVAILKGIHLGSWSTIPDLLCIYMNNN